MADPVEPGTLDIIPNAAAVEEAGVVVRHVVEAYDVGGVAAEGDGAVVGQLEGGGLVEESADDLGGFSTRGRQDGQTAIGIDVAGRVCAWMGIKGSQTGLAGLDRSGVRRRWRDRRGDGHSRVRGLVLGLGLLGVMAGVGIGIRHVGRVRVDNELEKMHARFANGMFPDLIADFSRKRSKEGKGAGLGRKIEADGGHCRRCDPHHGR